MDRKYFLVSIYLFFVPPAFSKDYIYFLFSYFRNLWISNNQFQNYATKIFRKLFWPISRLFLMIKTITNRSCQEIREYKKVSSENVSPHNMVHVFYRLCSGGFWQGGGTIWIIEKKSCWKDFTRFRTLCSKSLYISRGVNIFCWTEIEIWAGFGPDWQYWKKIGADYEQFLRAVCFHGRK